MATIGSTWAPNTWVSSGGWAINTWAPAQEATEPPTIICFRDLRASRPTVTGVQVIRPRVTGVTVEKC